MSVSGLRLLVALLIVALLGTVAGFSGLSAVVIFLVFFPIGALLSLWVTE